VTQTQLLRLRSRRRHRRSAERRWSVPTWRRLIRYALVEPPRRSKSLPPSSRVWEVTFQKET